MNRSVTRFSGMMALALSLYSLTASVQADLLDQVQQKGKLTVGTEARFPPFEFVEDGKIKGYSADMMKIIMDSPEFKNVSLDRLDLPWQGILPGLQNGKFDYVVTSVTATPERMQRYHLSAPIADATMAVLKRADDDNIQSADQLGGLKTASQAGSAQLAALEKQAKSLDQAGTPVASISTYTGFDEAYADLAAGRVDAVVNSLPNLLDVQKQRPDMFKVVGTFGDPTYFTWAGRNDDESASLNALMDKKIHQMEEDGTLEELQQKWFGAPMDLPAELPAAMPNS
ncbi:transporter substrate-binding domain-containing protein [Salinicola sp. NYA28a]